MTMNLYWRTHASAQKITETTKALKNLLSIQH